MNEVDTLKQKINRKEFDALGYEEKYSLLESLTKLLLNTNPTESIQYGKTTLLLARKMEDQEKIASTLLKISKAYYMLSQSSKALQYAFEALKIYEDLKKPDDAAKLINNIATIYYNLADYDKAFQYNSRALEIHLQRNNEQSIAGTYINLGLCHKKKEDIATAISYMEKGLEVYVRTKDLHKASYAYHNIGSFFLQQSKYLEALEALNQALFYRKEVGDFLGIAYSSLEIGNVYRSLKEEKEAIAHYEDALKIAQQYNFRDVESRIYGEYSDLCAEKKDFEVALEYYKKFSEIKDQILQDNNSEQIEKLSFIYEMEKKEKEIEERSRHLEELKIINESLESFSYSISHDLRAPLRAINSFSTILLQEYQDKFEQEALRYLHVIHTNTIKMDQLITDLLSLSKVSRSELISLEIDMNEVVADVFQDIVSKDIQEKIAFSIEKLHFSFGDKNLIRIVWVNLITNAIKFTLSSSVRFIVIGSYLEGEMVVYYIKDSGIGFNQKYASKLFNAFQRLNNTEGIEGTGIGLAIIKRVMDRLGGNVWAKAAPNEGATFFFSLPSKSC